MEFLQGWDGTDPLIIMANGVHDQYEITCTDAKTQIQEFLDACDTAGIAGTAVDTAE
jgi:hypothetical protein